MTQELNQVKAFVLHSKAFQENSLIFQLFSFELGRFSIIAKGIKSKRSQARKAILQPFTPLAIEFTGKSDLKTLIHCEKIQKLNQLDYSDSLNLTLAGRNLACGYYANELLLRACPERVEFPTLFENYFEFVSQLKTFDDSTKVIAPLLRRFELNLLTDVGLIPELSYDITQNEIQADKFYQLDINTGFKKVSDSKSDDAFAQSVDRANQRETQYQVTEPSKQYECALDPTLFAGSAILSLANDQHSEKHSKACQRITAAFLKEIIGDKPLQSRKMWLHYNNN